MKFTKLALFFCVAALSVSLTGCGESQKERDEKTAPSTYEHSSEPVSQMRNTDIKLRESTCQMYATAAKPGETLGLSKDELGKRWVELTKQFNEFQTLIDRKIGGPYEAQNYNDQRPITYEIDRIDCELDAMK